MTAVAILYIPKWTQSISFKSVISIPVAASDFPAKADASINKKVEQFSLSNLRQKEYFQEGTISPKPECERTEEGGKKCFLREK